MRDFRDAKAMAQSLRDALSARQVVLTHSESLELVAKAFGLDNWNVLSAKIQAARAQAEPPPSLSTAGALALPDGVLPVLPLRDIVVFPHQILPLFVGRPKSVGAVTQAMASDRRVLLLTQKSQAEDFPQSDALYQVGVVALIQEIFKLPDGSMKVMVRGVDRVVVTGMDDGPDFLRANATPIAQDAAAASEAADLAREAVGQFAAYAEADTAAARRDAALSYLTGITEPGLLADTIAQRLRVDLGAKQEILETAEGVERLRRVLAAMSEPTDG